MILFWQAALKKKAGAKRPRVITRLITPYRTVLADPTVLEVIQVEPNWMMQMLQKREAQ